MIINPVKATCIKYKDREKSIQGMNDTCFGICAAFSGTFDTYAMDPKCTQSCVDLIEAKRHELFGVGSCDHQTPYRPVAWGQVPRFVPNLVKNGMNPDEAKNVCYNLCSQKVPNLVRECQETCDLDRNAIESFQLAPQAVRVSNKHKKKVNVNLIVFISILIVAVISIVMIKYKYK